MRKLAALTAAVAMTATMVSLAAQGKPTFAGKWTLQADPAAAAPAGGGGGRGGGFGGNFCGMECTIVQDATTLTVTRTAQNGPMTAAYKLDGTDSKITNNFGGNAVESTAKAMWEADKLTITTSQNFNGNATTAKMVVSMDASGNMVIERTAPGRNGGEATTTKQVYKKG